MGKITNKDTASVSVNVKDADGNVSSLQLLAGVETDTGDFEVVQTPMTKARIEAGTIVLSGAQPEPDDASDSGKQAANPASTATPTTTKVDDKKDGK